MKWFPLFICSWFTAFHIPAQEKSKMIVTDADRTLIPEGITIDDRGTIYISSLNHQNIVKVNRRGKHSPFIDRGAYGFGQGLGMKIDRERGWLWALSYKKDSGTYTCRVHAFDLNTGQERQQFSIVDTAEHLLNDLIVVDDRLYITDTYFGAVYMVDINKKAFTLFKKHQHLAYPNGITFNPEKKILYVASYRNGLVSLDPATGETALVTGYTAKKISHGLDGLVFYRNSIVGVYNLEDRSKHCVIQYRLSADGRNVVSERIIDQGHPMFHEPTTLTIDKRYMYVIANSHLGVFNANKESTSGVEEKLLPVAIIRYKLKK